jgi:tripartite-type tricarboxylate transporter receptor subunit TctC
VPAALIARLNRELVKGLNRAEVRERFINTGAEVSAGAPEAFSAKIKSDIAKFGALVREARIRPN